MIHVLEPLVLSGQNSQWHHGSSSVPGRLRNVELASDPYHAIGMALMTPSGWILVTYIATTDTSEFDIDENIMGVLQFWDRAVFEGDLMDARKDK